MIEVGLSTAMQESLGAARFVQLPAIGAFAQAGEHRGVVEDSLTAAEFYSSCDCCTVWMAELDASIADWLVGIAPSTDVGTQISC